MNRTCLLSLAYDGAPMVFNGQPIYYSALVNEVLRELKNALFYGSPDDKSHTEFMGLCEAFLVMYLYAKRDMAAVKELRGMSQDDRSKAILDFAIEHEDEIERIKPEFVLRVKAVMAAGVEGTAPGKPA